MEDYQDKSGQLLALVSQLSDIRAKKVLLSFVGDLINIERTTLSDQPSNQNNNENNNNGSSKSKLSFDTPTKQNVHLIDVCLNHIKRSLNTAQPSILWKTLEYCIAELDYINQLLDRSITADGTTNGNVAIATSRLEEMTGLVSHLYKDTQKMNTIEYNELLQSVSTNMKKITLRIKSVANNDQYANVEKYGWIEKRCGNKQSFKTWKKMWFILKSNELHYFIKDRNMRKSMHLNGANNNGQPQQQQVQQVVKTIVNIEGELGKKKEGKGWKVRWMKLTEHSLAYFHSQKDREPLGVLNLNECKEVGIYKEGSNKFSVVLSTDKFYFKTSSKEELNKWVEAIRTRLPSSNQVAQLDLSLFCLKGIIELGNVVTVQECNKFTSQPHSICIQTDKKNYYLSFEDLNDKMDWYSILKRYGNPNQTGTVSRSSSGTISKSGSGGTIGRRWEIGQKHKLSVLNIFSGSSPSPSPSTSPTSLPTPPPTTTSQSNNNNGKETNNNNSPLITPSSGKSTNTTTNGEDEFASQIFKRNFSSNIPIISVSAAKLDVLLNQQSNSKSTTPTTATTSTSPPNKTPNNNNVSIENKPLNVQLITNDNNSNSSTKEEDSGDEDSGDEQNQQSAIPMSLKSEILRRQAITMTKTFKVEVTMPPEIPDPESYTFLFSDHVLVDQVKSYIFRRVTSLANISSMDYRLCLDEENILEIEFLKFAYSNTMIELALKTCGMVRVLLCHARKDKRTKANLFADKLKNSTGSQETLESLIKSNSNNNNNNNNTNNSNTTTPITSSPVTLSPLSSPSGAVEDMATAKLKNSTSELTSISGEQPTTTPDTTPRVSPVLQGGVRTNDGGKLQLLQQCGGWVIEEVDTSFVMDQYQVRLSKKSNTSFYKSLIDCQSIRSYLGVDPRVGPIAFSLVKDIRESYRGILHTKHGVKMVQVDPKQINFGNIASLSKRLRKRKIISHLVNLMDSNIDTKHLTAATNQAELQKELLSLEERQTTSGFKFGIVVCKQGQSTDNEIFSNEASNSSQEYEEFLDLLGERVELMGWQHYSAGLDVRANTTGTHSLYAEHHGSEIMFHVATMLPFTKNDPQQIERKRQVGNDICVVVFHEGGQPYLPSTITSQFNHIVIVVSYDKNANGYNINMSCKDGVPLPIEPPTPTVVKKSELREFLLSKLVNAELASLQAPAFSQKISRTRETLIKYFIEQYM